MFALARRQRSFCSQEVCGTIRTVAADAARIRMRQSHFKSTQLQRGIGVSGLGGASQPVPMPARLRLLKAFIARS